jgi:selenium metabolism protein YedF
MIQVNAIGDTCPIPVVKAKNAMKELNGPGQVEVLVDNEIAVQNLTKMAEQKGYGIQSEKKGDKTYSVIFTIGTPEAGPEQEEAEEPVVCYPDKRGKTVVVITSAAMGNGNDELGGILMKGFLYALSQQEELPGTILFYNGGASLTCQESPALEDLKSMEAQGVEILTCGTCLDFYGLKEKLAVGSVTNMYTIAEKLTQAEKVIRP